MKKNKGTSYGELMIVLLIVGLALIPILKISSDYLRTLVFAREMFVINSYLQSKYQMLIAYRNKWLEKDYEPRAGFPEIREWFEGGNYCIDFNTTTQEITTSTPPCQANLISGKSIPGLSYYINIEANTNTAQIKVIATSSKFLESLSPRKYLEFKLEGLMTRWIRYLSPTNQ